MWCISYLLLIGVILHTSLAQSIWSCQEDTECDTVMSGMVCRSGTCVCPTGTEIINGISCAPVAPYHASPCMETWQCRSLMINFECRKPVNSSVGACRCQEGNHYFLGRCWKSIGLGEQCTRNEECMGTLRDPFNAACVEGICDCAEGHYLRQRGECRESRFNIGDDCIVNEDCRFENGACSSETFKCVDPTAPPPPEEDDDTSDDSDSDEVDSLKKKVEIKAELWNNTTSLSRTSLARAHSTSCSSIEDCPNGFVCTTFGYCACPRGYYSNAAGTACLAELGSPSTDEQCVGLLAEVRDGICRCPPNFYYDDNMRDCVKTTRRHTDSCVNDYMCQTFGASTRCGEPGQFLLRTCECIPEEAIWDQNRQICRLFAGIGERCEVDSDCLAGNMEILCVHDSGEDSEGGICSCPEGFTNIGGLCLTTGLSLGEACQVASECADMDRTDCSNGYCSCREGYFAVNGTCAPIIGGSCVEDHECITDNSICGDNSVCQCEEKFVEYDAVCWPHLDAYTNPCLVTAQCQVTLGNASFCEYGQCMCSEGHHLRDGGCWPKTGLFESCSRTSECYLEGAPEVVQCRNSLCQCRFEFPYSEELRTCMYSPFSSAATTTAASIFMTLLALIYVKLL